ncbi:hypothetical protein [Pseudofrankia asymbiotica]|uniref:Uncharacterized protein n=1 Tax=Pseudofrankia asymbiotica TaxID=1834516 RepID=A0A1V2I6L9_9ACTN|nr:hypothetical protein [Pseudofrankia asymbiotica]ONH26565.1 hypothetical protein BL253_24210 [Pseudofrankia asymbiotica]
MTPGEPSRGGQARAGSRPHFDGARRAGAALTRRTRAGLVLAAVLGVGDLLVLGLPGSSADGTKPPTSVLVFGALMGVVTLACVVIARASRSPATVRVAAASRALSALGALPGLFTAGVHPTLVVLAAAWVLLNLSVVCLLIAPPSRSRAS